MGRINRSTIIPVSSEQANLLEKWKLPEMQAVKSPSVRVDEAQKHSAQGAGTLLSNQSTPIDAMADVDTVDAAFEKGYQDGLRVAQQKYAEQQQALGDLLKALENPVQSLGDQVAEELVALALDIAESLLKREIERNPEHLSEFISSAMKRLPTTDKPALLRLNPLDLANIKEHINTLQHFKISWQEDESIPCGSFEVLHDESLIYGGIDAMLKSVSDQFSANHNHK